MGTQDEVVEKQCPHFPPFLDLRDTVMEGISGPLHNQVQAWVPQFGVCALSLFI